MSIQSISKIKTALSLCRTPRKLILAAGRNGLLNFLPDRLYLKAVFKAETGYPLRLDKPQTYNEKLQWIKLYNRKPEYTLYADKYRVRSFVSEKIGAKYLIPLIGVYARAEEIPWEELPDRFVLKCSHASGYNIICKNKKDLNIREACRSLDRWLRKNAYWSAREWCYKDIKPCIICEEFIDTEDGNTPDDYKFMCFNGEPKLIQIHHDRYGHHTLDYYTPDWEKSDLKRIDAETSEAIAERPDKLDEMMSIARTLSENLYYARIDLYYSNQRVYFGEITLYPTGGFSTFSSFADDLKLGSYIKLPTDN